MVVVFIWRRAHVCQPSVAAHMRLARAEQHYVYQQPNGGDLPVHHPVASVGHSEPLAERPDPVWYHIRTGAEFEESSAGKVSRIPQGETASEGGWCLSLAALHDRKTKGRREVAIEPNIRRQGQ